MNKLKSILVLLILALLSLPGKAEIVTRYKTVVDTVKAIEMLRESNLTKQDETAKDSIFASSFSKNLWKKVMGRNKIPIKRIAYQHKKRDSEDLSFEELVKKYYNTPEKRKWFSNNAVVKGRFDGLIEDEIGVFPAHEQMTSFGDKCYGKLNLVSRYGTIESCLISDSICREYYLTEDGPFEEGLTGGNWSVEVLYYPVNLVGWKMNFQPEGSTIQHFMTFCAPEGVITNTAPYDVAYLPFDECLKLMKVNNRKPVLFNFNYCSEDEYGDGMHSGNLTIAAVSNSDIYPRPILSNTHCVVSKDNSGTIVEKIPSLVLNNGNYDKIEVSKDYFGKGNDALIVYYNNEKGDGTYDIEGYRIEWASGDVEYVNGSELAPIAWVKSFTGTFNSNTGQRDVREVVFDDYDY